MNYVQMPSVASHPSIFFNGKNMGRVGRLKRSWTNSSEPKLLGMGWVGGGIQFIKRAGHFSNETPPT